jgi:hypothetical protein
MCAGWTKPNRSFLEYAKAKSRCRTRVPQVGAANTRRLRPDKILETVNDAVREQYKQEQEMEREKKPAPDTGKWREREPRFYQPLKPIHRQPVVKSWTNRLR